MQTLTGANVYCSIMRSHPLVKLSYMFRIVVFVFLICFTLLSFAADHVKQVRVWAGPDKTRVVFDVSGPVDYHISNLKHPDRILVDLPNTSWRAKVDKARLRESGIQLIRHVESKGRLQVVIELSESVQPSAFLLKPNETYGHRLVLDLLPQSESASVPVVNIPAAKAPVVASVPERSQTRIIRSAKGHREFIIALDAGHGGEDPGAIGRKYKAHEKEIVLSVARKLQASINQHPDMQAVLIRQSDYFINLKERVRIARRFGADMFISLHADSFKDSKAKGASVFVLSERGASSEAARWLAEKENRSDLVGGVKLDNKSNVLASVLLDLSQTATQVGSEELARKIIGSLGQVTELHHRSVQRAGFVVLKSPDIPSILVELGFLSHPKGEQELRDPKHQQILAEAIKSGVVSYIKQRSKPYMEPQSAWLNQKRHLVRSGDTLASIASKYQVSVEKLKQMNSLYDGNLRPGQKIIIPFKLEA